jgi:hypothetical protein
MGPSSGNRSHHLGHPSCAGLGKPLGWGEGSLPILPGFTAQRRLARRVRPGKAFALRRLFWRFWLAYRRPLDLRGTEAARHELYDVTNRIKTWRIGTGKLGRRGMGPGRGGLRTRHSTPTPCSLPKPSHSASLSSWRQLKRKNNPCY